MVTEATSIVSYQEMKTELRLDNDLHQTMVTGQIEAAVSWVERLIGRALVDRAEVRYIARPTVDWHPLVIRRVYPLKGVTIKYWAPGDSMRVDPPQTIASADLGSIRGTVDGTWEIHPPADGWPELEPDTLLAVTVTAGLASNDIPAGIKLAIVAATRHLYEGGQDTHPTHTMYALVAPFKRWA